MKRNIVLIPLSLLLSACCLFSDSIDYRQEMRDFVIGISEFSKTLDSDFYIIPQNGIELITLTGDPDGIAEAEYIAAIDGNGQEDLFYGYNNDNEATPERENTYLTEYLDIARAMGKVILVTDYCSNHDFMDNSYNKNYLKGYISYAADERNLGTIPDYPTEVFSVNSGNISALNEIKNFLYLINPENYVNRNAFIEAVANTNYDLLIIDLFFNDGTLFSESEINQLRLKANGGTRLIICYMSIGEAEDYRFYWNTDWDKNPPDWLDKENPDWEGNYKVKYWDKVWQNIIYGSSESYLNKIINAGFDGVYLDIIDAFEYFE